MDDRDTPTHGDVLFKIVVFIVGSVGLYGLLVKATGSEQTAAWYYIGALVLVGFVFLAVYVAHHAAEIHITLHQARMEPLGEVVQGTSHALPSPMQYQTTEVRDFTSDGKAIRVDREALDHFIAVCYPRVRRDGAWRMQDSLYGQVTAFLATVSDPPLLASGKGWAWRDGVSQVELRERFLYPSPTGARF